MNKTITSVCFAFMAIFSCAFADTFPTDASEFTIDVPEGEVVTIADLADYTTAPITHGSIIVNKRGLGRLVFNNRNPTTAKINIYEGEVTLARDDNQECAHYVNVFEGTRLVIKADNQFRDYTGPTLYGNSVMELNGHSDVMQYILAPTTNRLGEVLSASQLPRIVNSSEKTSVLTVIGRMDYCGAIEGKIKLDSFTQNDMARVTLTGNERFEALNVGGTTSAFHYSTYLGAKMVIHDTIEGLGENTFAAMGDITFYCGDKRVESSNFLRWGASSSASGKNSGMAFDDNAGSWWNSETGDREPYLMVMFKTPQRINAYQLSSGPDIVKMPKSWDLYLFRNLDNSWILADSRRDAAAVAYVNKNNKWFSHTAGKILPIDEAQLLKLPFDENVPLSVTGRLMVSSTEIAKSKSLEGTGVVELYGGTVFRPGDIANWSGTFEASKTNLVHLQLDPVLGGAEQRIKVKATDTMLSVENAREESVNVMVDSALSPLSGWTLADGNGPVNFVKSGSGEVLTEMSGVDNTGKTEIREGSLTVVSAANLEEVTASYIRVRPLSIVGGPDYIDGFGYNWSIGSMWFLGKDGTALDLSGAQYSCESNIRDYDAFKYPGQGKRTIVGYSADNKKLLAWIQIKTSMPVSFSAMKWSSSTAEGVDKRIPTSFQIEVSEDGNNWNTVCVAHSEDITGIKDEGGNPIERGPFALGALHQNNGAQMAVLPEEFIASRREHGVGVKTLKAQYFMFCPRMTLGFGNNEFCYGWEVSEFDLYLNGERLTWRSDAGAIGNGQADMGNAMLLVDNVSSGDPNSVRVFRTPLPDSITINAHEVLEFDSYGYTAAGGSCWAERMPISWELYISNDRENWTLVDRVENMPLDTSAEFTAQGPWRLTDKRIMLAPGETDAISDRSPVEINAGAMLAIESSGEKFGTLSGAGELRLVGNATAEINALPVESAAFSGRITGPGELVISGEGVQTFDGADCSGVRRLVLAGGVLAGTANFGGNDLTVIFEGGALDAELSGIGTFTSEGKPKVFVHAIEAGEKYVRKLISAEAVDEAAKTAFAEPEYSLAEGAKAKRANMRVDDKAISLTVQIPRLFISIR